MNLLVVFSCKYFLESQTNLVESAAKISFCFESTIRTNFQKIIFESNLLPRKYTYPQYVKIGIFGRLANSYFGLLVIFANIKTARKGAFPPPPPSNFLAVFFWSEKKRKISNFKGFCRISLLNKLFSSLVK